MTARAALVLCVAIAGCGQSAAPPAAAPEHRAAAAPAGQALFEATCEPCHLEQSEQRPVLATASLSPPLANRALREVLALGMPPAGAAEIAPSERAAIAGWLCAQTRRSPADCAQVISRRGRVAPTGDLYFSRASRIGSGKLADQDVFVDGVRVHSRPSARIQMLDPTFVLLTTGVALAACADAGDDAARQACVDAYLAAALDPVPAPPPAAEAR